MTEATRPADGLSILALASGIACLVLALFVPIWLVGAFCMLPLSALAALTALVSGVASLVRTTLKPELEGRWQAIAALAMVGAWGGVMVLFWSFVSRRL